LKFAKALFKLRTRARLTRYRLGQEVNVDPGHVGRLERGERRHPGRDLVLRLSQALLDNSGDIPCNSRAIVIEVKSSGANKWVVGNKNPDASDVLWVLVRIPEYSDESPRFFILIAQEIHNILAPGEEEYRRKYKEMNGQDYTGTGVYSLRLDQIQSHEHQWEKVLSRVEKVNI
jgi:transcriptional regulator with XRE-family HTH domain